MFGNLFTKCCIFPHKNTKTILLGTIIPGMQTANLHEFRYNVILIHYAQLCDAKMCVTCVRYQEGSNSRASFSAIFAILNSTAASFDGNFNYVVCKALKCGTCIRQYIQYTMEPYMWYTVEDVSCVKQNITLPPFAISSILHGRNPLVETVISNIATRHLLCHNNVTILLCHNSVIH